MKNKRLDNFTDDELTIIAECLKQWPMEDLGLGEATRKLEKEIREELEMRAGIIHGC